MYYSDKAKDSHNKEVSSFNCNCLAVLSLVSTLKNTWKLNLEQFKYIERENKVVRHITDDLGNCYASEVSDETNWGQVMFFRA